MPHVVAQPCHMCKFTECVTVCPVNCFHEGDTMLYIDPLVCTDCAKCVVACPVDAIFLESDVPSKWNRYIKLNSDLASKSPSIKNRSVPMSDVPTVDCDSDVWGINEKNRDYQYRLIDIIVEILQLKELEMPKNKAEAFVEQPRFKRRRLP
jgi:ferredoxin